MTKEHSYSVWIVAHPSKDIEGEWVAHCLEFDVVSQGSSLAHAIEMVMKATEIVVIEDLIGGHDPLTRRAPEEFFEMLSHLITSGERVPLDMALAANSRTWTYALPLQLHVTMTEKTKGELKPILKAKPHPSNVAFAEQVAC